MIKIGSGGTGGLGYDDGLKKIHELGLQCLEVEFTYGVNMKNEDAIRIGEIAKKMQISLSIHAPYYINLAANEKKKVEASKKRILDSCERAHNMGARYVVFHAGFYQKKGKEEVFEAIKEQVIELNDKLKEKKWNVALAPELTGKPTQFGDIDELLRLKEETQCHLTVDFSHWRARNQGNIDYAAVFDKLKKIKNIHSHFSGIEWTDKGERRHMPVDKEDVLPFAREVLKRNIDITIINESPYPIDDAYKIKKIFEEIG